MKSLLLFGLYFVFCSTLADEINITSTSDDLINCGTLICPKETVKCFSSYVTNNSETVQFAQCIDDKGHVLLGDGKGESSQIHSTPIANTESPANGLEAVESAQKTIEFWKNYVQRINLSLQGLSKSLEN